MMLAGDDLVAGFNHRAGDVFFQRADPEVSPHRRFLNLRHGANEDWIGADWLTDEIEVLGAARGTGAIESMVRNRHFSEAVLVSSHDLSRIL